MRRVFKQKKKRERERETETERGGEGTEPNKLVKPD